MDNQTDPQFLAEEAYHSASDFDLRTRLQDQHRTHPQSWFQWVFEHLDLPAQAQILEAGSGPGDLWQKNQERVSAGWRIVLTDLSFGMVQEAQRRLGAARFKASWCVSNLIQLPFPDHSFEAVLANGVLDHVPSRRQALTEIWRVLKPGGKFYTTTGGRSHLQEIEQLVQPILPKADFGGDPERFGLENGARMLSEWFSQVRRTDYPNQLIFRQAEPILQYILSEAEVRQMLNPARRAALERFVRAALEKQEAIEVTCQKGLFEAVREGA